MWSKKIKSCHSETSCPQNTTWPQKISWKSLFSWPWKIGSSVFFLKKCSYNYNFLQEVYSGCECNQLSVNLPVILLQWPCFHVVLKLPMLMSFYVKALKLMLPKSLRLSHCNWPKKVKLLCGFPTLSWWKVNPLTPKISFIILLTVCHLAFVMLVWRIWYWIN